MPLEKTLFVLCKNKVNNKTFRIFSKITMNPIQLWPIDVTSDGIPELFIDIRDDF
jgi:hypothetical protein